MDATRASSHLQITVIIPPVFRVLQITPMHEDDEYHA
jgi:hypothetical protein